MGELAGASDLPEDPSPEHDDVWFWRCKRYLKMGFSAGQAQTLADAGADYRAVKHELERGCSHELAVSIFI